MLKQPKWRSEKFRRAVSELDCMHCGAPGPSQAAHANHMGGKGMGLKASDALVAALCHRCHAELDQGKALLREERRAMWDQAYIRTMQTLIERGKLGVRG